MSDALTPTDVIADARADGLWILVGFEAGPDDGRVAYRRIDVLGDRWVYWEETADDGHITVTQSVEMVVQEADDVGLVDHPPFTPGAGGADP